MFTGLIQNLGVVVDLKVTKGGAVLWIELQSPWSKIKIGESIAVNGCCLTVVEARAKKLRFDISLESLRKTNMGQFKAKQVVNLERAMLASERLGGHFVLGHVDGVGKLLKIKSEGDGYLLTFEYPKKFQKLLIEKGSITVDGISLTAFDLKANRFSVAIIPHTWGETNLHARRAGDNVNLEFDILGKYALRRE